MLFLILVFLLAFTLLFSSQIETVINTGTSSSNAVLDEAGLQVHFIDVGQGDGIVIEFPDGKTMIVDAGPSGNADNLLDYIDNNIFEHTTTPTFDYMLITHSDTDHIGAVDEVLDAYQVNTIYRPEIYATYNNLETVPIGRTGVDTQTYEKVIARVLNEPNSTIIFNEGGLTITGGSGLDAYIITFYSPLEHYYTDVNDYSPIITLQYREKTIMLTGDAPVEVEEDVMGAFILPQVDVLKLGHHGSETSTGSSLLSQIDVTYAVISAGENNTYGHPDQETINRLLYSGVNSSNIFSTIDNGSIIANVTISGELNLFTQVESLPVYIEWEYVVYSLIGLLFVGIFVKKAN